METTKGVIQTLLIATVIVIGVVVGLCLYNPEKLAELSITNEYRTKITCLTSDHYVIHIYGRMNSRTNKDDYIFFLEKYINKYDKEQFLNSDILADICYRTNNEYTDFANLDIIPFKLDCLFFY